MGCVSAYIATFDFHGLRGKLCFASAEPVVLIALSPFRVKFKRKLLYMYYTCIEFSCKGGRPLNDTNLLLITSILVLFYYAVSIILCNSLEGREIQISSVSLFL